MLSHPPFYWKHFKKYVVIMGSMLNDISIVRESNGQSKTIKIPISFFNKDKNLNRLLSDPQLRNTWRNYLPRIGFEMGSPYYDPSRKDNATTMHSLDQNGKRREFQFAPAPYNIPFTAYLWSPYYEDGLQVTEQILPFFQPEYFVRCKEVPEMGLERDVSVSLIGVNQNDMLSSDFEEHRIIEWQFEFVLKGHFYGPINQGNVIKKTLVDYKFDPDAQDPFIRATAEVVPFAADKDDPHIVTETIEEL